jgi:hypothetical protein
VAQWRDPHFAFAVAFAFVVAFVFYAFAVAF